MSASETVGANAGNEDMNVIDDDDLPILPIMVLPEPTTSGGMPLLDALRTRRSSRKFGTTDVPLQELANLLWAAFGLSRPDQGRGIQAPGSHTAPAAHNWQEIDIYVAIRDGLYLYEPEPHLLRPVLAADIRPFTTHAVQPFVLDAPLDLIYVADLARMDDASEWDKSVFPWADTSFISENVYLYCASAGLATIVRALFDRPGLSRAMRLRPSQLVTFSQPIGYAGECGSAWHFADIGGGEAGGHSISPEVSPCTPEAHAPG